MSVHSQQLLLRRLKDQERRCCLPGRPYSWTEMKAALATPAFAASLNTVMFESPHIFCMKSLEPNAPKQLMTPTAPCS